MQIITSEDMTGGILMLSCRFRKLCSMFYFSSKACLEEGEEEKKTWMRVGYMNEFSVRSTSNQTIQKSRDSTSQQ